MHYGCELRLNAMQEMAKGLYKKLQAGVLFAVFLCLTACSDNPFPKELVSDRYAFVDSLRLIESAGPDLLKHEAGSPQFLVAVEQLETGYKAGFRVRDVFLDYVNPEIKVAYNKYLLRGTENYVEGVREGNAVLQEKGQQQVKFWFDYWNENKTQVLAKLNLS